MADPFGFLAGFSIFTVGPIGAFTIFVSFWLLTYLFLRPNFDKAGELALQILLAPLIAAIFLAIIGINLLIIGIAVIIIYFASYNHFVKGERKDFTRHILVVFVVLLILALVDDLTRIILFLILLVYVAFAGEQRIHEKKKEKEEAKEEEKEKD